MLPPHGGRRRHERSSEIYAMFPNLRSAARARARGCPAASSRCWRSARILRTGARLLLLDEITEGLAPVIVQKLGAHDRAAAASRATRSCMVEQNFRFAAPLADRFYVMEHGRIVETFAAGRARGATWPCCTSTWASELTRSLQRTSQEDDTTDETQIDVSLRRWPRALSAPPRAQAQISDDVIKIGVLNDMSGLYADLDGPGSVVAASMAVEDFGAAEQGHEGRDRLRRPPEQARRRLADRAPVVRHRQGRRDRRRAQLRRGAGREPDHRATRSKAFLVSGAATVRPDRQGVLAQHHPLDLRHLDAGQRHRQRDRQDRRRHLVLPDRRLRLRPRARARHRGGRARRTAARCSARCAHPLNTQDFSSFLLQAQASKAKIIGLANAGGDTINSIKQAAEFGIVKGGQNLAGLLVFLTDMHAWACRPRRA